MKLYLPIFLVILALLVFLWPSASSDDQEGSSASNKSSGSGAASSGSAQTASSSDSNRTVSSSRKRQATVIPKVGSWHPTEKGQLVSPYNDDILPAIGVVTGSKMTDSEGNTFIVPPFEDSPFPIQPVAAPVPGQPGFIFNPWTEQAVDVRGLPPGTLIRDPNDPDPDHTVRVPPAPDDEGIVTPNTQTEDGIPEIQNQSTKNKTE